MRLRDLRTRVEAERAPRAEDLILSEEIEEQLLREAETPLAPGATEGGRKQIRKLWANGGLRETAVECQQYVLQVVQAYSQQVHGPAGH